MNEKKLVHSFKSYLDLSPKNNGEKNGTVQELKPKLLNGELVVGTAHSVVMLNPLCERDKGLFGSLFVTNYRLSFVPAKELSADECVLRNLLLGPHDVPLTAVSSVWLIDKARRRRLKPYGDMPSTVRGLRLVCKNMKVLHFDFGRCPIGSGRKVTISLLHHAFPKRHDLLFAYEYREQYYPTLPSDLNMFHRPSDWKRELDRCECPHWRITCINGTSDAFMLTAGETLIVPNSVLDFNLMETARHFRSGRVPVWVWGRAEGGALLRSGELLQTDTSNTAESVYLEQVRRSHPKLTPPHVIYLCGNSFMNAGSNTSVLPPLQTLQSSHKKIIELCTPSSLQEFWTQDSQFYSVLDSSRWLRYVASCLAFADEAAEHLAINVTVLLQEGDGVDYCAVVSCLTQMLLDPHFRSISGFQSLIQKEWIALGHPFCDRFGLPRPGGAHTNESPCAQTAPVFSLFLDCVWQLTEQFPASFQFTQSYLTALSDCLHNELFDTFLFNSPRDRELAVAKNLTQRPVWDWGEQFSEEHKAFFYNPLYAATKYTSTLPQRFYSTASSKLSESRLKPYTSVANVELWSQRYERWLLPLDVLHAGSVQHQLINSVLLKQIQRLSERLTSLSILNNRRSMDVDLDAAQIPVVSRFYPFTLGRNDDTTRALTSMPADPVDASQVVDRMSLLNAPD